MGPGGGDRAWAGSSGQRMKLKGRRKAPACQNSLPFLATRCLGAEPGSRVHRGQTQRVGMAQRRAVQLSPKKPSHAVCAVGVETHLDVHR